ncbi:hypothetical protein HOJ01_01105 [bacterium]|jgi:hypothetical protein|nr:hypothetical protein [bacterium]MBT6293387.1 hypothetical protein [bacterium]
MEKKEILIPISKIKGLEKVVNSLDFQVEEKSQLTPSDSFENQEDNNFNLKNFDSELTAKKITSSSSNFNIDIKNIPSIQDKYLKINLKSFLDMIDSASLEFDVLSDQEIVVNSTFLMSIINSKDSQSLNENTSNQLIKGVLIGVFVSIFLFLFVKLI